MMSIGMGKMIVEFFSAEMELSVCKEMNPIYRVFKGFKVCLVYLKISELNSGLRSGDDVGGLA